MHRCSPCHSGWKSQTAGLAYVQTPVLCLFKYILRGFCALKDANLLCATTIFGVEVESSCWDPSVLAVWRCPREFCRWPFSSVRGQTSSQAQTWCWLCLFPVMLGPWQRQVQFDSVAMRCCSSFKPTDCMYRGLEVVFLSLLALQSVWNRGTFILYIPVHTSMLVNAFT